MLIISCFTFIVPVPVMFVLLDKFRGVLVHIDTWIASLQFRGDLCQVSLSEAIVGYIYQFLFLTCISLHNKRAHCLPEFPSRYIANVPDTSQRYPLLSDEVIDSRKFFITNCKISAKKNVENYKHKEQKSKRH